MNKMADNVDTITFVCLYYIVILKRYYIYFTTNNINQIVVLECVEPDLFRSAIFFVYAWYRKTVCGRRIMSSIVCERIF